MKQFTLILLGLTLAVGCKTEPAETALHARITLEPTQKATCVLLHVESPSGERLAETRLERVAGKDAFSVAIFRGTYPEEIRLIASPLYGNGCAEPLFANGERSAQTARFPLQNTADVTLPLAGPTPDKDGDLDGFMGDATGGPDCDDADLDAYPGASESCVGGIDLNCNDKLGCQDPTCASQVCSDPPALIAFTTNPQRVRVGACSGAVTVQARSASNAPRVVTAATQVSLTAQPPGVTFYSDAACSSSATRVTIAAGASDATFYFRSTAVGSPTLTATVAGVTPATQAQTIDPGPATKLVFHSAAQTLPAGQCSGAVALRTEDAQDNASPLTSAISVGLSAGAAVGFTFYSDAGCTTQTSSVSIAAGSSTAIFYFRGTRVGQVTMTADPNNSFATVAQNATIQPGPAVALKFISSAKLVTVNACSTRVDFRAEDASGNAAPVSATTSVALSSPSSVTFFSDAACTNAITAVTVAAGEGTGAFHFKAATTGSVNLTLSAQGLSPDTQAQTIVAAGPTTLAFVNPPTTLRADQCSAAVTVQSRDSFTNPSNVTSATTVTLSAPAGSEVTFYSNSGCSTVDDTVQINGGSNTSNPFYVRARKVGTASFSGTSGIFNPASHNVTVTAAPPNAIEFTSSAHTITAGRCSPPVMLRSRDAFGNTSAVTSNAVVALSANPSTEFTFHTDAACATAAVTQATILNGQSTVTFYFSGKRSGNVNITANANGAGLNTQSQMQAVVADVPTKLAFTSTAQSRRAGVCSAAVNVRAEDANGNAAAVPAGAVVSLSADATGFAFYSDSGCATASSQVNIAPGDSNAQAFYWKGTKTGPVNITVASNPLASAVQGQTITAAPQSKLVITSAAQSVPAGQCSGAVVVEARDEFDNPATNASNINITLADSLSSASAFTFHTTDTCGGGGTGIVVLNSGSTTQSFFFKGTQAGPVDVTVSSGILTPFTQQQTILAGPPNKIVFTTGPHTVPLTECSPANTLRILDVNNNPSPVTAGTSVALTHNGTGVTFYAGAGCSGAGVTSVDVLNGLSEVTFSFKASQMQSVTLTATASGLPNPSAQQTQTITAGAPAQLQIIAGPANHSADANCSTALTAQLQDTAGNPTNATANTTVSLTSNASPTSSFTFFSDAGCTTPESSVQINIGTDSRNFYFRGRIAELVTITAAVDAQLQDTHAVTITPGAAKVLKITSQPQTGVVADVCSAVVAVQTRDQWTNVANVGTNTTVDLSDNPNLGAAFKFYSGVGCTGEASSIQITSGTSAGSFYFKSTKAGLVSVEVNVSGYTMGDSQEQEIVPAAASRLNFVTAAQSISPNTCSAITTVEVTDPNENRVSTPHTITLSGTPAAGMTFYTSSTCDNPATTTVATAAGVASFYWKATGSGSATITAASDPLTQAQQVQTLSKLVKSGTCTIASGDSDGVQSCAIPPADAVASINRAILFWQATGPNATAADSATMCYFESTSSIACERTSSTAGNGAIDVAWYVVEFPASSGVYVEHRSPANLPVTCGNNVTSFDVTLNQAVNAGRSFVLLSTRRGGNSSVTSIYKRALLANDGTKVTITTAPCGGGGGDPVALQIVDFPGAVVQRGSVSMGGATASDTGLPQADPARSFLLYTIQMPDNAVDSICQRSVRGSMSSDTRVDFSRGNGSVGCTFSNAIDITYERVLLPSGNKVQALNAPLGVLAHTFTVTLPTAVDLTRAVAFTGGQAVSGQSMGETGSTGNNPNVARARLRFTDATSLDFLRTNTAGTTADAAQFTGYVVEFVSP